MSVGPFGGIGASAAGAPLSQSSGSEADRAQKETANQQRAVQNDRKADEAAGVAAADGEEKETAERDADGRRLWEVGPEGDAAEQEAAAESEDHQAKDPTGNRGQNLDLSG